jgi:anthranilate synthase component II
MKNMKLLLIDNYDSFVYNLYQYLKELGHEVDVIRNNAISAEKIQNAGYKKIIISPGPGNPQNKQDFGECNKIIKETHIPILGICLGHQGIIHAFGGKIFKAKKIMHGKTSTITHNKTGLFEGIKNPLTVMRYHSLTGKISKKLTVTARSEDKTIMAVQHKTKPIFGLQFHPESILTQDGKKILQNFCDLEEPK